MESTERVVEYEVAVEELEDRRWKEIVVKQDELYQCS